ncbi:hypothetical protein GCM10017786_39320 [Amycolatopsis deserti]|uniref:HTH tetR-type domain-containing protein n=1 Tax=Amycolatopsis deserti TaxID=185696 RepID=A0ABQ3J2M4_9PSEU|nr:TetR/AcrR family transcriptional regulator [Amycolatopsis deserti]GHF02227.1 hypothetical protein GCM10017786_39320 [Amycolatopsis deserti]
MGGTRRQEILDAAIAVMAERGVAGLNLSEVARRVGIRQPSLYKHFPSRHAVYDELFRLAAQQQLEAARKAASAARPGLEALTAYVEATGRIALAQPVLAQLLGSRPVPDFEPSREAFRPSVEYVEDVRAHLRAAVEAGELAEAAAEDDAVALMSILVTGTLSQQLANEPNAAYDEGRFTRLIPQVLDMFVRFYSPGGPP